MSESTSYHASSADPHRLAHKLDERAQRLRPVGKAFSSLYGAMPEEVKKKVLINRRVKKIHEQFAAVTDPFILKHTNSVYLLKHQDPFASASAQNGAKDSAPQASQGDSAQAPAQQPIYDLVVYVDSSLVAAELNARRELIRLKYREQFHTVIDVFEIRISRGAYKDKHPFAKQVLDQQRAQEHAARPLTPEDAQHIDALVANLPDGRMKDSFIKAMTAQKRFSDAN